MPKTAKVGAGKKPQQSQRLCWAFTINNYTKTDGTEIRMDPELCTYVIEGKEVGESGTPHIQGYCVLKTAQRLTQLKALGDQFHWEPAKGTPYQNYLYCAKGEQSKQEWDELKEAGPNWGKNAIFEEHGQRPATPKRSHKAPKDRDAPYTAALAAPTVAEGIEIIRASAPRDYCMHGDAIERNLTKSKLQVFCSKFKIEDFNRPALDLTKPVFLTGKSNTGKTQFALAHFKRPLLVSHIDKLKTLSPDNDGIVFDDMAFNHWPIEAVIHLLDTECDRQLHVRYGTVTIPAYTRKIFTSNKENIFYGPEVDAEQRVAVERRYRREVVSVYLFGDPLKDATSAYDVMVGSHHTTHALVRPGQNAQLFIGDTEFE